MNDNLTDAQIKQAVEEKRAVIRWSHGEWENNGALKVYGTPERAEVEAEKDTRGHCHSMADEVWSELCTDYKRALKAQYGSLIVR